MGPMISATQIGVQQGRIVQGFEYSQFQRSDGQIREEGRVSSLHALAVMKKFLVLIFLLL